MLVSNTTKATRSRSSKLRKWDSKLGGEQAQFLKPRWLAGGCQASGSHSLPSLLSGPLPSLTTDVLVIFYVVTSQVDTYMLGLVQQVWQIINIQRIGGHNSARKNNWWIIEHHWRNLTKWPYGEGNTVKNKKDKQWKEWIELLVFEKAWKVRFDLTIR